MESSNTQGFVSCTSHTILNFFRGWSVLSVSCCLLLWKIPKTKTLEELIFLLPAVLQFPTQDQMAAFCLALSNKIMAEGCWFLGVGRGRGVLCQATVCFPIFSCGQQVIIMPLTLTVSQAQQISLLENTLKAMPRSVHYCSGCQQP